MKRIYMLLISAIFICACEQELDVYEGKSGIYFSTENILLDTISVSWGMKPSEIKTQNIKLRVVLFGEVANHDRTFTIDVVASDMDTMKAEEGIDYESFVKEYTIPAKEAYTDISINLKRRDGLEERKRRFTVVLNESPELGFLYSRQGQEDSVKMRDIDYQRVIVMDEYFPQPRWWYLHGESRFGKWSQKKAALICDVMGIDREEWLDAVIGDGKFTHGYMTYVGKYMHRWLQENPTEDEDGKPMEMGPASKN